MTRSEGTRRFGLVLAYAVATVLAQVGHLHGHEAEAGTHCRSVCEDSHPHLSGHPSPDLGHAPTDCPACQLRSLPQVIGSSCPTREEPDEVAAPTFEPVALCPLPAGRPSCRAPPLA